MRRTQPIGPTGHGSAPPPPNTAHSVKVLTLIATFCDANPTLRDSLRGQQPWQGPAATGAKLKAVGND